MAGRIAWLGLGLVLALAACGGGSPAPDAAPRVGVTAPRFGDADPTNWPGRSPADYPVHGIDTSRWQAGVDWPKARAAGVNFAYIKATEGGDLIDPGFKRNWRAARHAGVARGAYHFWYHCRPGIEQARWFIRHVPRETGALPPVLDLEWTPFSPTCTRRPPGAEVRAEALAFLNAVERHYGQRPIIYATVDIYKDAGLDRLAGYEFWLRSVADHPSTVFGTNRWTFWQYTATGLVPGVAGEADINVFNGSAADWQAWLERRVR